jgi:predicted DNA-binding protein (UPF0251 family)
MLKCAYAQYSILSFIKSIGENSIPRRRKRRNCCLSFGSDYGFKPRGIPMSELECVILNIDELEAMKFCDFENMNQVEASEKMQVSRGTIQRLLYSGRKKVVDALINSKAIEIINNVDDNT